EGARAGFDQAAVGGGGGDAARVAAITANALAERGGHSGADLEGDGGAAEQGVAVDVGGEGVTAGGEVAGKGAVVEGNITAPDEDGPSRAQAVAAGEGRGGAEARGPAERSARAG